MTIGYLSRAALTTGYLAALGQTVLLSQSSPQTIRPQRGLEQRLTAQQESLHSRLVKTIAQEEERLLPSAKPGEHVSEQIGFLVYDDLAKLASLFDRTIDFDGLRVYQVNGHIVVDNGLDPFMPDRRFVFYSDDMAIEAEGFPHFWATFKRLKIMTIKGRKTVQEDSQSFDKNFAYVIGMSEYDFSQVHSAVIALQRERGKLRKVEPKGDIPLDTYLYLEHPVDGIKFEYAQQQLKYIREGLLDRYGLLVDGSDIRFGNTDQNYKLMSASKDAIHVSGVYWNFATGDRTINSLLIRNMPAAQMTRTFKVPQQPDKVLPETLYPKAQ